MDTSLKNWMSKTSPSFFSGLATQSRAEGKRGTNIKVGNKVQREKLCISYEDIQRSQCSHKLRQDRYSTAIFTEKRNYNRGFLLSILRESREKIQQFLQDDPPLTCKIDDAGNQ